MRIEPNARGTQPLKPRQASSDAPVVAQRPGTGPLERGMQALGSLFGALYPVQTQVAKGLFELASSGSLQAGTATQLAQAGKVPGDLLSEAMTLATAASPFGPAGVAAVNTVIDVLQGVGSVLDLVDSPAQRRRISERLPHQLALALGQDQPAGFQQALSEFLSTGNLSERAFEALGAQRIPAFFAFLHAHREDLDQLSPEGRSMLGEAILAGEITGTSEPSTYAEFQETYTSKLSPESRAYLQGQSAFSATGRLSEDGLRGTGSLGWRGALEGRAEGSVPLPGGEARGYVEGSASAFAGAQGAYQIDESGLRAEGTLGAAAEVEAGAGLSVEQNLVDGALSTTSELQGRVKAQAAAKVDVEAQVGFDEKGGFQAYADADARLMAEAEAEARGHNTINLFGFKITSIAFAKVQAAAGVEASGGAGYKDGKLYAIGSLGAGLGAGAEVGTGTTVELPEWAQQGVNSVMGLAGKLGLFKSDGPGK